MFKDRYPPWSTAPKPIVDQQLLLLLSTSLSSLTSPVFLSWARLVVKTRPGHTTPVRERGCIKREEVRRSCNESISKDNGKELLIIALSSMLKDNSIFYNKRSANSFYLWSDSLLETYHKNHSSGSLGSWALSLAEGPLFLLVVFLSIPFIRDQETKGGLRRQLEREERAWEPRNRARVFPHRPKENNERCSARVGQQQLLFYLGEVGMLSVLAIFILFLSSAGRWALRVLSFCSPGERFPLFFFLGPIQYDQEWLV